MATHFENLVAARDAFNRGGSVRLEDKERVNALILQYLEIEQARFIEYTEQVSLAEAYAGDVPEDEDTGTVAELSEGEGDE